jgi:vacuolar protein sorting-associated protein 54
MSAASGGRRDSSDVDVFLPHSDGETSRYDPLAISGRVPTPTASSSSRVSSRLRIPSVKEVAEKSEGPNWTMSSPAQNLAAALNDPSDREYDLFTRTWGMYFVPNAPLPPSTIPNIQLGDFIRYLKETSSGRKVHRSIVRQLRKESQDEKTCPTSPTSPALPPLISKLHQEGRMFDLSSVPRLFMQADFCLEDLATFQQVLPLQELGPGRRTKKTARSGERGKKNVTSPSPNTPSTPPVSSKLLHEKLSQYLDVIEVHLAHQIAQRSDLFFSTLSSQQELQDHIMSVRQNVVELRMCLRDLDRKLTHKNLELMRLCSQTHRNSQVLQKLKVSLIYTRTLYT